MNLTYSSLKLACLHYSWDGSSARHYWCLGSTYQSIGSIMAGLHWIQLENGVGLIIQPDQWPACLQSVGKLFEELDTYNHPMFSDCLVPHYILCRRCCSATELPELELNSCMYLHGARYWVYKKGNLTIQLTLLLWAWTSIGLHCPSLALKLLR